MNSVVLIGRLTKDPEMRYTPDQKAVVTFTLAVDRPFAKDKADFLRVVVFGKQAENVGKYLSKGRQVGVQGRIQTNSYQTQTGETRYTTDIVADRVQFLGTAGDKPRVADVPDYGFEPSAPSNDSQIPEGFQAMDDDDDDLPF